jgi:DNA-binding MarR family transcriptional regulator
MADLNSAESRPLGSPLYLRDEELKEGADLLFFACSDLFVGEDETLTTAGIGRAHRRALHVIARNPGLTVSALLRLLRVTKQSTNRVLNDLLAGGYVERKAAATDRRMRQLRLTAKGEALETTLWEGQRPRLVRAFREAGPEAVAGFRRVLAALVTADAKPMTAGDKR